jgi:hypothetical protein
VDKIVKNFATLMTGIFSFSGPFCEHWARAQTPPRKKIIILPESSYECMLRYKKTKTRARQARAFFS